MVANIFGASPVQPLEDHIRIACDCAQRLGDFVAAVLTDDWSTATEHHAEIVRLEKAADELKKEIRTNLPRSLFMPVPRQDLLDLVLVQDRIANRALHVADLMLTRKMTLPSALQSSYQAFLKSNLDAAEQASTSVHELDELYTTAFRGAEAKLVSGMLDELDATQSRIDDKAATVRKELFALEDTLSPVDVMFLYKVIELTGDIGAMSERVGRRLEILLSH